MRGSMAVWDFSCLHARDSISIAPIMRFLCILAISPYLMMSTFHDRQSFWKFIFVELYEVSDCYRLSLPFSFFWLPRYPYLKFQNPFYLTHKKQILEISETSFHFELLWMYIEIRCISLFEPIVKFMHTRTHTHTNVNCSHYLFLRLS